MAEASPASRGAGARWLRPRVIIPALLVLLTIAVLVAPQPEAGGFTLTTYSAQPGGARGIYQILQRLGWTVARRRQPLASPLTNTALYAVLDPPQPLSASGVSALLGAVRAGATAIVVPRGGTPLADSLGVRSQFSFRGLRATGGRLGDIAAHIDRPFRMWLEPRPDSAGDTTAQFPRGTDTLVAVGARGDSARLAILGLRLGRGRVVVIGDASFLRNAVVRRGAAAILAVRLVEWADSAARTPILFDEYDQGFGEQPPSLIGTVSTALADDPAGRMLLQLLAAGLIVLVAVGARPIAPAATRRIERRSPLEHIGALARAYERAGASRIATRRLVRGLRRRHPLGAHRALGDDDYLALIGARFPETRQDVARIAGALDHRLPPADFAVVGTTIARIERILAQ